MAAANPAAVGALIARIDAQLMRPAWELLVRAQIAVDRPLGVKPKPNETHVYWSN